MGEWIEIDDTVRTLRPPFASNHDNTIMGPLLLLVIPYSPEAQATVGWWDAYHGCFRHIGDDGPHDIEPTHYQRLDLPGVPPELNP